MAHRNNFELEALEPRVLMSGDGLLAGLIPAPAVVLAENVMEERQDLRSFDSFADRVSDSATPAASIFEGVAMSPLAPPPETSGTVDQDNVGGDATTAKVQGAPAELTPTPPPGQAKVELSLLEIFKAEITNPISGQLTETLRVANAPPEAALQSPQSAPAIANLPEIGALTGDSASPLASQPAATADFWLIGSAVDPLSGSELGGEVAVSALPAGMVAEQIHEDVLNGLVATSLAYSPPAQPDDAADGVGAQNTSTTEDGTSAATTTEPELAIPSANQVQAPVPDQAAPAEPTPASPLGSAKADSGLLEISESERTNPLPGQLTETLRVANAPPEAAPPSPQPAPTTANPAELGGLSGDSASPLASQPVGSLELSFAGSAVDPVAGNELSVGAVGRAVPSGMAAEQIHDTTLDGPAATALAYSPPAEPDDGAGEVVAQNTSTTGDGATAAGTAEPEQAIPSASQAQAPVQDQAALADPVPEMAPRETGSPSDAGLDPLNPTVGQLTETLTVANAPPSPALPDTQTAQPPVLPGLQWSGGGVESLVGQVVYLDFDGASNVTYHGPVVVEGINVPAFNLSATGLGGQEGAVIDRVLAALNERFSEFGVTFTTTRPQANPEFSTIYVGGSGIEFARYSIISGVAEGVDVGNLNRRDNAFVFAERSDLGSVDDSVLTLTRSIQHEAGHLLGYRHTAADAEPASPLSQVADTNGHTGDVIEIDLKQLFTSGVSFAWRGNPAPPRVGIPEGTLVFSDTMTGAAFQSTGKLWFIPGFQTGPPDTSATDRGFQGTVTLQFDIVGYAFPQSVTLIIDPGISPFSLSGSVGDHGDNYRLDVYRVQQRLLFLNFRGEKVAGTFPDIMATGEIDRDTPNGLLTIQAIQLFQGATDPIQKGSKAGILDRADKGKQTGKILPSSRDLNWLNATNAPVWTEFLDTDGAGGEMDIKDGVAQPERFAVPWTISAIQAAAGVPGTQLIVITALSERGWTKLHSEHKSGNDIDVRPRSSNGLWYDFTGVRTSLNHSQSFWQSVAVYDNSDSIGTAAKARSGVFVGETAWSTNSDFLSTNVWNIEQTIDNLYAKRNANDAYSAVVRNQVTPNPGETDEQRFDRGFDVLVPVQEGPNQTGYDRGATVALVKAFGAQPNVIRVIFNDPRARLMARDGTDAVPATLVLTKDQTHGNHFHVDVKPPLQELAIYDFNGKTGDVIEINLKDASNSTAFVPVVGSIGSMVTVVGGKVLYAGDFATSGKLYFVPDVASVEAGFQGETSLHVQMNGVQRTVRITVKPGTNPFKLNASVGAGGTNIQIDVNVLRVQQRLKYLGFPSVGGAMVIVDGKISGALDDTIGAIKLFQEAIRTNYVTISDGRVDPSGSTKNWLSSPQAPRWQQAPSSFSPFGFPESYGTSWAIDLLSAVHASSNLVSNSFSLTLRAISSNDGVSATSPTRTSGMELDLNIPTNAQTPGTGTSLNQDESYVLSVMKIFYYSQQTLNPAVGVWRISLGNKNIVARFNADTQTQVAFEDATGAHLDHMSVSLRANFIPSGPAVGLINGLSSLQVVLGGVDQSVAFNQSFPLGDQRMIDFFGFNEGFKTNLSDPISAYFQANPEVAIDELLELIKSLPAVPFADVELAADGSTVTFGVIYRLQASKDVPINFGVGGEAFGISVGDGDALHIAAEANFEFSFGVDLTGTAAPGEAFFVIPKGLSFRASLSVAELNLAINLGFLGADIDGGNIELDANLVMDFVDPNLDGKLTLNELVNTPFGTLVSITVPRATFYADLPITVTLGDTFLTDGTQAIVIEDDNIFAAPAPSFTFTGFDDLKVFGNLRAGDVVTWLKQLGDWLKTYRDSDFFDLQLPFTGGKRVGDWFDSGTAFADSIYKRMILREVVATGAQTIAFRTLGQLTADVHFTVTVGTDAPVAVTVLASATNGNSALAHAAADFNSALLQQQPALAAKVEFLITPDGGLSLTLKDGQTADTLKLEAASANDAIVTQAGFTASQNSTVTQRFNTIQGFVARLNDILSPLVITPHYDAVTKEVTMNVHFDWHYSKTTPVNLGGDLGPIANFSTTAKFNIDATLTFDFTLGFVLKPRNTPELITSAFVPPPSDGRLHANSSFYLHVGTDPPVLVTLSAVDTANHNSLADLAAYINTRLTAAGLGNKLRAQVTGGTHLALAVLNEDGDGDGHLDVAEDLDHDGKLDRKEDLPQPGRPLGDGRLDIFEDLNGDGVLQAWEDVDLDGHLDVNEDFDGDSLLGTVNEDVDGDGHLDVTEDTLIVNGVLDSLLGVQTLRIVADAADPIFTEVGFLPETARAESRGLFLENAKVKGTLDVSLALTGSGAKARFSIFGIGIGSGSAVGQLKLDAMLRSRGTNPLPRVSLTELFAAANAGALGEVLGNSVNINLPPKLGGSFNLTLGDITLTPSFFTLPADAQIIIGIPDITNLKGPDGQLKIHAEPTLVAVPASPAGPGIWVVYPNLEGLFQFSKLDIPSYILALDALVQDLGKLSTFDFLNKPLPLINQSLSGLIGQAATLAQWVNDVRSNPGDTLTALETKLETALGINPSLFTLSIDNVPNPSLAPSGTPGNKDEAVFNPQGGNNALRFTNTSANKVTVRFIDEGHIPGVTNTATAVWDSGRNTLTIEINSGFTTAANVIAAVSGSGAAALVTVAKDTTTTTGDGPANDGSGVITKTALKLHFNYTLAYGLVDRNFELDLADLVALLPEGSPAIGLLAGITSFIDVGGTGKLNISASATLTIDFGLDLTNPCDPQPFLYDTTGIVLKGRVTATDLDFEAALGPLGIFVENGSAALDGDGNPLTADDVMFSVGLIDNNDDGRHYLSETFFNDSNLALTFSGGVGATLPLYFPVKSLPYGGSSGDTHRPDGYPDNQLVFEAADLVRLFKPYVTTALAGTQQVTIQPVGDNNDFIITSTLHTGVKVKFLHSTTAAVGADYDSGKNSLFITLNHGVTTAAQVIAVINTYANGFSALPVATADTGAVKVPVLLITPDFNSLFLDINDLCELLRSSGVLFDGLDELLGKIEGGLDKVAFGGNFPLVGDKLAQGANFIRGFRNGLLAELRSKLATVGGDPINLAKQAIWNVLGQPGLDILVRPNGDDDLTGWSDLEIGCANNEITFNLRLKKSMGIVDTTGNPIAIDLGIPSLGLEVNGNVKIEIGFDVRLKFGINKTDGFYFDTSNTFDDDFPTGNGRPELVVDLMVTVPGLNVTGRLFFLQLNVKDGHTAHIGHSVGDHDPNLPGDIDPSKLYGRLTVDVTDPVGTDKRLTFAEMRSGGFSFGDVFKATFGLTANVNLDLLVTFGGDAAFPNFAAEFDLDWSWMSGPASVPTVRIAFNHLTIDAGSFVSNVLAPILKQVQQVTGPIEPIAKLLVAPIPGLSDVSGKDVTFLDLAERFGYLKPSTRKFLETVVNLISIINDVGAASSGAGANALTFDLGSYTLNATWPAASGSTPMVAGPMNHSESMATPSAANPGIITALKKVLSNLRELGFEFPILTAGEIFKLIQGRPATLVEYTMPPVDLFFSFSQVIPLFPPFLTLIIGGEISTNINLTFGFDTQGILLYKESHKVADLFEGFFIKDKDDDGNELTEVKFKGGLSISAASGLSFGPVSVLLGATGTLFVELQFDLNDPDNDGKVRPSEIIANARRDVRCIFDINGQIYFTLSAFVEGKAFGLKFRKDFEFAKISIYEFDLTCPPPILAHTNGTQLVLHMGPEAHRREEIDANDGNESFTVQSLGGMPGDEHVLVKWSGFQKEFDHISSIIAKGGNGNDIIDARGVLSPVLFDGGTGDDLIYASDNASNVIHGDSGDDTLIGTLKFGNQMMYGGDGNDLLTGSTFRDVFFGGAGNDTLIGNGGNDHFYGEDGNDILTTLAGNDYLDGGDGNDVLDAGEGHDRLWGGTGNDTLRGGRGNDWLVGGLGADTLDGGPGGDILVGDEAASITIMVGSGSGNAVTWNLAATTGPTTWNGTASPTTWDVAGLTGAGDDLLIGGAGSDVLFGGGGDDSMFGGALTASGVATPLEQDGVDFMDGGAGDDVGYADDAFAAIGVRPSGPTVSGRVWSDTNGDGIQDSGERGMAGVTVQIYNGTTFVLEDAVTTGTVGDYSFIGLHVGSYFVKFVKLGSVQVFSPKGVGSDDTVDSDADMVTDAVAHTVEGQTAGFTLGATSGKTGLDAGLRGPPIVVIDDVTKAEGTMLGSLLGATTYGNTAFTFTVNLSAPSAQTVTVQYATLNGLDHPAVVGTDLAAASGTLTFTPGTTNRTVTVMVGADNVYESSEDFRVLLSSALEGGSASLTIAKATGQGVILDDDPKPTVSIGDATVSPMFSADVLIGLSGVVAKLTIHSDPVSQHLWNQFSLPEQQVLTDLNSTPQQQRSTLIAALNRILRGNSIYDAARFAGVTLSAEALLLLSQNPTGGFLARLNRLLIEQAYPLEIAKSKASVTEAAGGTVANFTLHLSNPSDQPVTVDWTTADFGHTTGEVAPDSAHFGADYTDASGTSTFAPGVTELTDAIKINILDDALDERDEHFLVVLANPINAGILDGFGNANIQDDDAPPVVDIVQAMVPVTEGDAGYQTATFTISLNVRSGLDVKVTWATARGTATDLGTSIFDQPDFVHDTGEVIFRPDDLSLSREIKVKVLGDTVVEGAEEFFVNLVRADNATIGDNHAIVAITETESGADVGPWNVQFSDVKYTAQEDGGFAAVTLVRAAGSSEAVAVLYSQNGSATAGLDYTSTRTLVFFAEAETEKTILIPILQDMLIEGTETVALFLRNPTGGLVRGEFTTATLCILDDEPRPTVRIDDKIVTEADPISSGGTSDTQTISFTLHLSAMAEIPVNVPWSTNNRSAIGGFDYSNAAGTATFGIHALTTTITVTVHNDDIAEPVEEFVINLGTPDQATLDDRQALGTIIDDDKTPISGRVFLDEDGDGHFDFFEHGLAGLQVTVTDHANTSMTVATDPMGVWHANVLMGATKIEVIETGLPHGVVLSTGNSPQTATISDTVAMAADVGYKADLVPDVPADAIGEGSGGLDDTVFGGDGDDILNGGGGADFLIGGHWLLGAGCACAGSAYDAHLEQADGMSRINLAAASRNDGGTITGLVFDDLNGNGSYDGPDTLVAGVTVNLFDRYYALVASAVTDGNGRYSFSHLAGCDYAVQFVAPPGRRFVPPGVGGNVATDSDADTLSGLTPQVPIFGTGTASNVDAGVTTLPLPSNGPWALSFGNSVYNVWEPDGLAQILIQRMPGSFEPLVVFFTQGGTANAGADYTALFRRLVDLSGAQDDIVLTLNIVDDGVTEGLETIRLFLLNPTGGPVNSQRPEAVVLIFDLRCTDNDRITGSQGDDVMLGDHGFVENGGALTFIGGSGNDALRGGSGNDMLHGQSGNDRLDGGNGDDLLVGGEGDDVYLFDTDEPAGSDILTELPGATNGIDRLDFSGTTGVAVSVDVGLTTTQDVSMIGIVKHLRLTLSSGNAIEDLIGGGANDTLLGNVIDNVMTGGPGSDLIDGRSGTDKLVESRDADFVLTNTTLKVGLVVPIELDTLVGIERVELAGGSSKNLFDVSGWTGGPVGIDGRAGTDTILSTNDANFTLTDTQLLRSPGTLFTLASVENAILTGGAGDNMLDASSFTGSATLIGAAGIDMLLGGPGDNVYSFVTDTVLGSDTIIDSGGMDSLDFSGTTTLGVVVDLSDSGAQVVNTNLTLALSNGSSIENVVGGALDDMLTGNALPNRITGGPGNDTMSGGAGDDIYVFDTDTTQTSGAGHDTVTEASSAANGVDTLDFSGTTTLAVIINLSLANIDQLVDPNLKLRLSSGSSVENVIGGAFNNRITGNDLNNTFVGGAGNDTYVFTADTQLGSDTIVDSDGIDTLDFSGTTAFGVTVDLSDPGAQVVNTNLTLTLSNGSSIEHVVGGAKNDTFIGNDLDNAFVGGAGDDTYVFDVDSALGADTIDESGGGNDTLDFAATTTVAITVNLSNAGKQSIPSLNPNLKLTLGSGNTIENIIGGGLADALTGNALDNVFTGGGGLDTIVGGAGINTVREARNANFTLTNTSLTIAGGVGSETDTLANIQRATLAGGAGINSLDASAFSGAVTLDGGGGDDTLTGGSGDDTYVFHDGWGMDTIQESTGGGSDALDFSRVTAGGTFNILPASVSVTQGVNAVTYIGAYIEKFIGTSGDDTFNVTTSTTTAFSLDGGNSTNDRLTLTGTGGQPVTYNNFEQVLP